MTDQTPITPARAARKVASLMKQLERLSADAAKLRDKFRAVEEEAATLAANFDPNENGVGHALIHLRAAVDEMSGLV
jgi:hypothetical protein